jgi:hypothetical protein
MEQPSLLPTPFAPPGVFSMTFLPASTASLEFRCYPVIRTSRDLLDDLNEENNSNPGLAASSMQTISSSWRCELNGTKIWPAIIFPSFCIVARYVFEALYLSSSHLPSAPEVHAMSLDCVGRMEQEYRRKVRPLSEPKIGNALRTNSIIAGSFLTASRGNEHSPYVCSSSLSFQ